MNVMRFSAADRLSLPVGVPLRKLFAAFLLLLPFQGLARLFLDEGTPLHTALTEAHEFMILLSIAAIASFVLIKPKAYKLVRMPVTKWLLLFFLVAALSMYVNDVPVEQAGAGCFDMVKNVLLIYPFASFNFNEEDLFSLLRRLRFVAIILAAGAIMGEVLALAGGIGVGFLTIEAGGLYRVVSFTGMGNWNFFGIYMVLICFITDTVKERFAKGTLSMASIFSSAVLTMSRTTTTSLLLMSVTLRRKLSLVLVPVSLVVIIGVLFFARSGENMSPDTYFRAFGFWQSIYLLQSHPFLGVGPGMYGGPASVMFSSPIYNLWPDYYRDMIYHVRTIDSFWPSVWGELGITGFLLFIAAGVSLFLYLKKISRFFGRKTDLGKIGDALRYFLLVFLVIGFAGGINSPFVCFTYFSLTGIYISVYVNKKRNQLLTAEDEGPVYK